jgi:ABC-2 type transport system permease protein
MRELLLVLNLKSASFLQGLTRRDLTSIFKMSSSFLVFGGFAMAMFLMSRGVTIYLLDTAHIGSFLFHRFLSMVLYVFFITVNVGNIVVSYATLYRSQEVGFLMALPLSHAKIFLIKFVDNFFYSSSTLAVIGLAVLLGYGSYFQLPWYFYFFSVFFVFLPFMLIAGVVAVVTLMGLIKIATLIGVRLLLGLMVGIYVSFIYIYFKATNPVRLVEEVMKHYPDVNVYFGYLDPPLVQYLPNHWVTEFLYWSVNGNYERAVPYFFLLFLTACGLIVVAGLLARKYYYRTWLAASDAQAMRGPKRPRVHLRFLEFGVPSRFFRAFVSRHSQTEVLFKRDFWMFFREPSQWLHLVLMGFLIVIFLSSLANLQLHIVHPLMQAVSFLVIFLFNGFLVASVALRFVFPAVSLESDCFWSVRSSPLGLERLYYHKLRFALMFALIVTEILVFGSASIVGDDGALLVLEAVCGALVAITLTSLHLGAGSYFAIFREKNPIRVASSHGASMTFLGSMIYLGAITMILVAPLHRYFDARMYRGTIETLWFYPPVAVISVLSLLISYASTSIGLKAIKRDF